VATSHGSPGNSSVKGVGGLGRETSVNVPLTALVFLKVYVAVRTVEHFPSNGRLPYSDPTCNMDDFR